MTTGTNPSFLDLFLNLADSEDALTLMHEDSWLHRLKEKYPTRKLAFYGDHTWLQLFPSIFDRSDTVSTFFLPVRDFPSWLSIVSAAQVLTIPRTQRLETKTLLPMPWTSFRGTIGVPLSSTTLGLIIPVIFMAHTGNMSKDEETTRRASTYTFSAATICL